jgi:ABC-type transport system involved in cytochrome bd biosynthesis fused ATPase/permease subunit
MSDAITSVGDQLQHEAKNSNSAKCAVVDDNDIELSSSGGVTAGPESENGRTNGTQLAARSQQQQQAFPADNEAPAPPVYKVLVLGSQGVGKTTLVEQLMTSEYLANQENCNSGQLSVKLYL